MFNLAQPTRQIPLTRFGGIYTLADPRDLPPGASPRCNDVDFVVAGVRTRPGLFQAYTTFTYGTSPPLWLSSTRINGNASTLVEDNTQAFWSTDLTTNTKTQIQSPLNTASLRGIATPILENVFVAQSDLTQGADMSFVYTGANTERTSQQGPGAISAQGGTAGGGTEAAPVHGVSSISNLYSTVSITETTWGAGISRYHVPPSSTQFTAMGPAGQYPVWLGDLAIGDTVYIYDPVGFFGLRATGTYTVTAIGSFADSDGTFPYFQVQMNQPNSDFSRNSSPSGLTWQKTLSLIQMTAAGVFAPQDISVGNNISVSGNSVQGWNQSFKIFNLASQGNLTITAASGNGTLVTYTYTLQNGSPPGWQPSHAYTVGQTIVDQNGTGHVWQVSSVNTDSKSGTTLPAFPATPAGNITDNHVVWAYLSGVTLPVTVYNTGPFDVSSATILTGSTSGNYTTFQVSSTITASAFVGAAQAVAGSGLAILIDPGLSFIGGNTASPIYGTGTGGTAVTASSGTTSPQLAPGPRYAVVLFETDLGYITPASPPVLFYTTGDTVQITFPVLPIGPANVIKRIVAITAANGGIGGPFYYLPLPVTVSAVGQTTTIGPTVVNNNTSTSLGPVSISDATLLNGINISVVGNNAQQQREVGDFLKMAWFHGRAFYIGERVNNNLLINTSFDGGTTAALPTTTAPLGWTLEAGGSISVQQSASSVRGVDVLLQGGNSGDLSQTAYQNFAGVSILTPNTAYGVRIVGKAQTATVAGNVYLELLDTATGGITYTTTFAASSFTNTAYTALTATFNNGSPLWSVIPTTVRFRLRWNLTSALGNGIFVNRVELYPTNQPVYATQCNASYLASPMAVDAVTGVVDTGAFSNEPHTNIFTFLDRIYLTTATKTFQFVDTADEPSFWGVNEVSNRVGAHGPLAVAAGEEYVIQATRDGVYLFDGGNHVKISQEIQDIWDSIYWTKGATIWVKNDVRGQRILIGVPLPTPNFWLPNASTNSTPATPNVILVCSYLGLPSGRSIAESPSIHISMFGGNLLYRDISRKWTIWQISSPYADFIAQPDGENPLWLAGVTGGNGVLAALQISQVSDFGVSAVVPSYTTFGFSDQIDEEQKQLGSARKLFNYASVMIEGGGNWNLTGYPEKLANTLNTVSPNIPLASPIFVDTNVPLNLTGNRAFWTITTDGALLSWFRLQRVVMGVQPDPMIPVTGTGW